MYDPWTEQLSEYLDGDLSPSDRAALETHLAGCAVCRATLDELKRVMVRARALDDQPPVADLWPGVAALIGATRPRRRISFSIPQLLAAGIALVVASGGAVWLAMGMGGTTGGRTPSVAAAPESAAVQNVATRARPSYDTTVAELERILEAGRGRLDSTTVRVLEQNLALIDRAIGEARRAVATDSANPYLQEHLARTKRHKVALLRDAAALVAVRS